jgi:putative glutamine amidotransferase
MARLPLIGISSGTWNENGRERHSVSHQCALAVRDVCGGVPVMIPALGSGDVAELLERLDGVMLTGGRANVETHLYDGGPDRPGRVQDPKRDSTILPMIRACVDEGVPLFGICRGAQEMNVAYGGTLHVEVSALPGRMNHRATVGATPEQITQPRHRIDLVEGGLMRRLFNQPSLVVNSLHGQAVDRPAARVFVDALCEDGTIEAISIIDAKAFALGVQWHPEYKPRDDEISKRMFEAFGEAARAYAAARSPRRAA